MRRRDRQEDRDEAKDSERVRKRWRGRKGKRERWIKSVKRKNEKQQDSKRV